MKIKKIAASLMAAAILLGTATAAYAASNEDTVVEIEAGSKEPPVIDAGISFDTSNSSTPEESDETPVTSAITCTNYVSTETNEALSGTEVIVTVTNIPEDRIVEDVRVYGKDPANNIPTYQTVSPVEGTTDKYKFTMPRYDVTIGVILNDRPYDVICGEGIELVAAVVNVNGEFQTVESDTKVEATRGNQILVMIKEIEGKVIDEVIVTKNGAAEGDTTEPIMVTQNSSNNRVYQFAMPKYAVTVTATYKDIITRPTSTPITYGEITARISGESRLLPITDDASSDEYVTEKIITVPNGTPADADITVDIGVIPGEGWTCVTGTLEEYNEVRIATTGNGIKSAVYSPENGKFTVTVKSGEDTGGFRGFGIYNSVVDIKGQTSAVLPTNRMSFRFVTAPPKEPEGELATDWTWGWSGAGGTNWDNTSSDTTSSTPETSFWTWDDAIWMHGNSGAVEFTPADVVVDEAFDEETAQVVNDMKIGAPEGTFTEDTQLNVKPDPAVTADNALALDITFTLDGTAVQPANGATVTVALPIPPMFRNVAENLLMVFHFDNGIYTRVNDVTVSNGIISFNTTHFSTYVISTENLAASSAPESTSSEPAEATSNPSTGVAAVSVFPIAAIVSAVVIITKKKK